MRIGSWLFTRTEDLYVENYFPYSKKGRNRIFQPYIYLSGPSGRIKLHGKRALWSLLDAMFPNDPLPRKMLNEDLKDPFIGKDLLNGLLSDPDSWPHLRLHVRTGDWVDERGKPNEGTFVMSASASSSDFDATPSLLMLEKEYPESYIMPFTLNTKTRLITIPALVIPCVNDLQMRVVLTDTVNGKHLIFSVIEKNGSAFRPQRLDYLPLSDIVSMLSNIGDRMKKLDFISTMNYIWPKNNPLDAGMRYYERDDLEYRRFVSSPSFNSFNS